MSKKIRVLVDGVGGDVGQGILKSLLDTELNIELYASCISDKSSWLYKIENSYIFPLVSDENFIDFLVDFINKYKIDVYFPTVDSTLLKISKNKEFIESKTNVKIFIDNLEKIEICDDKYLTNKFLVKNSFYAPKTASMDDLNLNEFLSKNNYLIQTDAVKNYIIPSGNYRTNLEWLAYADEADILLREQELGTVPRILAPQHCHVQRRVQHLLVDVPAVAGSDVEAYLRVCFVVFRQHLGQAVVGEVHRDACPQGAAGFALDGSQLAAHLFHLAGGGGAVEQHLFACRREADALP